MKKQILFVLGLLMAFAVQVWSAEIYTLTTVKNSSNTAYANTYDVTVNGMTWNAPGNQSSTGYWRIGGKSITNVERVITAKSPMNGAANSMAIQHNGVNAKTVTVSSIKLTVASDAAFTNIVDEVIGSGAVDNSETGKAGTIQFMPSANITEWASQSYYKITFTVSNTSTKSNGGIDFVSATWYAGNDYLWTVTFKDYDGRVIDTQQVINGTSAAAPANPTYEEGLFLGWDTDFSNVQSDLVVTALYDRYASEVGIDSVSMTVINANGIEETSSVIGASSGSTVVLMSDKYIKQLTFNDKSSEPNLTWSSGEATYYGAPRKAYVWTGCTKYLSFKVNESSTFYFSDVTFILSNTNCEGEPEILDETKAKVDFYDWNGAWLKTSVVTKGQTAVAPINPTREGYTFAYWSKDITNVQHNMEVKAVYTINTLPDTLQYALPALNGFYDFTGQGKKGAVIPQYGKTIKSGSTYSTHHLAATADYTTDFQALKAISDKWLYQYFYNADQEHVSYIEDINNDDEMDFSGWQSNSTSVSFISNEDDEYTQQDGILFLPNCDLNGDGRTDYLRSTKLECASYSNGLNNIVIYSYMWYANLQQSDGSYVEELINLGDIIDKGSYLINGQIWSGDPSCGDAWEPVDNKSKVPVSPTRVLDMNNDGLPDLVDETNGSIWYQEGHGNWSRVHKSARIKIQDLNNDQIMDQAYASGNHIYVYLSQPDKSFVETTIGNNTVDNELYLYDFNRDGYVDILATVSSNNNGTGYAYSTLYVNNGNGTFTAQKTQNYTSNRLLFKACQDIDGDGNYDLLAFELNTDNKATGKVFQLKGSSNGTFAAPQELYTIVRNTTSLDLNKYTLNVADLDGDGKPEIWASRPNEDALTQGDITVIKSMNTATANTAPTAPAQPQVNYNDGKLNITWGNGSDAQTATADLTYALRIGTTPGGHELMNGHALADGTRCNFQDGNMGYGHSYSLDLSTHAPMTIYIAVQAVDAQHMGSAWSQEAVFEYNDISATFQLDNTQLRINESATATFTALPSAYSHEWIAQDGYTIELSNTSVEFYFNNSGHKSVTHVIYQNGIEVARETQYIDVFPNGYESAFATSDEMKTTTLADYTFDGAMDVVYGGIVKTGNTNEPYFKGWEPAIVPANADMDYVAQFARNKPAEIDPNAITVRLDPASVSSWSTVCLYAWSPGGTALLGSWPGTAITTQDEAGWWIYSFDPSYTNVNIIWNNGANGAQTVDITNVTASTCYSLNGTSGTSIPCSVVDCPSQSTNIIARANRIQQDTYYTIRFLNYDGTVLQTVQVRAGETPIYTGETPVKPNYPNYQFTNAIGMWNSGINWTDTYNSHPSMWFDFTHDGAIDYLYTGSDNNDYLLVHDGIDDIAEKQQRSDMGAYMQFAQYTNESITNLRADVTHDGYFDCICYSSNDQTYRWMVRQPDGSFVQKPINTTVSNDILAVTLATSYNQRNPVDIDRDGNVDYVYYYYSAQELLVLRNTGDGGWEEMHIPYTQNVTTADFGNSPKLVDLNADGYMDIFVVSSDGTPYILKNNGNQNFAAPQYLPLGDLASFKSNGQFALEDLNNDGYIDIISSQKNMNDLLTPGTEGVYIWYMGANGVTQQGFFMSDVALGNAYGKTFYRQRDHIDFFDVNRNLIYPIVGAMNAAPAAPTNVRTQLTNDGLLIEWDDAADDHTPAKLLRYNLSVKKAGKTGEGSYLISPQNGGNTNAAVLPDYQYITANRYFIPMSALESRSYEISLQAIDLWNAVSAFSAPIAVAVTRSPINVPDVTCANDEAVISYAGEPTASTPTWNFDGGTIVSGSGYGPYSVEWTSGGDKRITVTVDGVTYADTILISNPYDMQVYIPSTLLMEQAASADIPSDATLYKWYVVIGDDEMRRVLSNGIDMTTPRATMYDKRLTANGLQITAHEISGKTSLTEESITLYLEVYNSHGCNAWFSTPATVVGGVVAPTLDLVTVDANAHNVINFTADATNFPQVRILKETNVLNEFAEVATVSATQTSYTDINSNAEQQPDRYKIQGIMANGDATTPTAAHKTVHATISKGVIEGTYNLIWNAYEGANIVTYNILRGSSKTSLSQIASVAASATSYTDNAPLDAQPFYAVEYVLSSAASAPAHRIQAATALSGRSNIVNRNSAPNPSQVYYTVRFLNYDGAVLQSGQVLENTMPVYTGATPIRPEDATYTYTFSGWSPTIVVATADADYTAQFIATEKGTNPPPVSNAITVRLDPQSAPDWTTVNLYAWTGNGETTPCGTWPGTAVSQDNDGWWSYTFDESISEVNIIWNCAGQQTVDITGVTTSTCYQLSEADEWTGQYSVVTTDCSTTTPQDPVYYTIRFLNYDGAVLQSGQVLENRMPVYTGATPVRPEDATYTYTFSGWSPTIVAATSDADYTAQFNAMEKGTNPPPVSNAITVRLDPQSAPDWTTVNLYAWTGNGETTPCGTWPGTAVSQDNDGWWSYTFDESISEVNIIWNYDGQQTIDITEVTQSTCYRLNEDTYPYGVDIVDCGTPVSVDIEDIVSSDKENNIRKILINNVIYILRDDKIYTLQGQEVR